MIFFITSFLGQEDFTMIEKLIEKLMEDTKKQSISMCYEKRNTSLIESKLGGVPFMPEGGEWPVNTKDGKKLYFLIQLNFEEMPHMEGYPEKGLLQVFIANDDLYGADFDNETNQEGFRVLFYEDISNPMEEEEIIKMIPEVDEEEFLTPFESKDSFAIYFKLMPVCISINDYRFDDFYNSIKEELPKELVAEEWYNLDDEILNELYKDKRIDATGSRIGGYPFFTQSDPREYEEDMQDYELLFQIDTHDGIIMWGDSGVANFFIKKEDLASKDFSKVLYNWDCC